MSALLGVLGSGRSWAGSRFTETFEFFREGSTEDEHGFPVEGEIVLYSDIPGRLKFPTLTVSDRETGTQLVAVQSVEVHVAVGAVPGVVTDDFVRVTASTSDSSLVGRVFRVAGEPQGGQTTAHRYPVERPS